MTNKETIRLGAISFINTLPIYASFEAGFEAEPPVTLVHGHPAFLNRALSQAELDISPVSSIHFLRHQQDFVLLNDLSVSSYGAVESVIFVSLKPWGSELLTLPAIGVPNDSETSVALLRILLLQTLGTAAGDWLHQRTRVYPAGNVSEALQEYGCALVIGDSALHFSLANISPPTPTVVTSPSPASIRLLTSPMPAAPPSRGEAIALLEKNYSPFPLEIEGRVGRNHHYSTYYCHDLSALWVQKTGFPFVFAVWAARRQWVEQNPQLFKQIHRQLVRSREDFFEENEAGEARRRHGIQMALNQCRIRGDSDAMNPNYIQHYFTHALNYELTMSHRFSMQTFYQLYLSSMPTTPGETWR